MTPFGAAVLLGGYFLLLWAISWYFRKEDSGEAYFLGNRRSPWWAVAFGMIGTSLSGITFISVPGWVRDTQFTYYVMALGYLPGYWIIAGVLIPLYYRLRSPSIYSFLDAFAGPLTRRTGAFFFLASRLVGASLRLFLAAAVLYLFIGRQWGLSIPAMTAITLAVIWLYTFRSGIRTVVWTDVLQTVFLLAALGGTVVFLWNFLDDGHLWRHLWESPHTRMWDWNPASPRFSLKLFFSGMFIALVMTGLDQDMMQKNLSCRTAAESQRNVRVFSVLLLLINLIFLVLGALLLMYAGRMGVALPDRSDYIYPLLARDHMPVVLGMLFFVGLIAAALSSADSAITALTTAFINDFLSDRWHRKRRRYLVQFVFSLVILAIVAVVSHRHDEAVIAMLFKLAGYTYGPLLGLFAFGIAVRRKVPDRLAAFLALITPVLGWVVRALSMRLWGYAWGFELLLLNGLLLMGLLWLFAKPEPADSL